MIRRAVCLLLIGAFFAGGGIVWAEEGERPTIGVVEQLGETIPLEATFRDENGEVVELGELFDRPIALTLVYYRCPSICTPLLQEMSRVADLARMEPGVDYRIITISFDPKDSPELSRMKKKNFLATLERREVPEDGWRFLVGEEEQIRSITEAVGFYYARDQNLVDYVHAATVIFVSPEGKIVRYLNGIQFNPADLEMAVVDAAEGRVRSYMQRIQRLCYSYDPEGQSYVLQINRIILGVTLAFAAAFGIFLVSRSASRRDDGDQTPGAAR